MVDVSSNFDILLVDMGGGLLTGAMVECLRGTGFVCKTFNLSDKIHQRVARICPFVEELSHVCLAELFTSTLNDMRNSSPS
ncbi:hypothetical protein VNO77_39145 [Canavalia gladiata]|uniref:Uncharacterized protein n=1 Tax=Canavalia gladiata TaxID=3824 RepID=A0AAN9PZH7_CANGL